MIDRTRVGHLNPSVGYNLLYINIPHITNSTNPNIRYQTDTREHNLPTTTRFTLYSTRHHPRCMYLYLNTNPEPRGEWRRTRTGTGRTPQTHDYPHTPIRTCYMLRNTGEGEDTKRTYTHRNPRAHTHIRQHSRGKNEGKKLKSKIRS